MTCLREEANRTLAASPIAEVSQANPSLNSKDSRTTSEQGCQRAPNPTSNPSNAQNKGNPGKKIKLKKEQKMDTTKTM
jgi:hypothetical protein